MASQLPVLLQSATQFKFGNVQPQPVILFGLDGAPAALASKPPVSYQAPAAPVSIGTTSATLIAAGSLPSNQLTLRTAANATGSIWLNLSGNAAGTDAVVQKGIFLAPGESLTFGTGGGMAMPTGNINAISDNGTVPVFMQGA